MSRRYTHTKKETTISFFFFFSFCIVVACVQFVFMGEVQLVDQFKSLDCGVHLLLATPGRLWYMLERRRMSLGKKSFHKKFLVCVVTVCVGGVRKQLTRKSLHTKTQRKVMSDFLTPPPPVTPFCFLWQKCFFRIFRKNVEFFFFNEIDCKKF